MIGVQIKVINQKNIKLEVHFRKYYFYLPKQPKQIAKSEEQIRYEHVMKQLNR